jgi:hypothetical protein
LTLQAIKLMKELGIDAAADSSKMGGRVQFDIEDEE